MWNEILATKRFQRGPASVIMCVAQVKKQRQADKSGSSGGPSHCWPYCTIAHHQYDCCFSIVHVHFCGTSYSTHCSWSSVCLESATRSRAASSADIFRRHGVDRSTKSIGNSRVRNREAATGSQSVFQRSEQKQFGLLAMYTESKIGQPCVWEGEMQNDVRCYALFLILTR